MKESSPHLSQLTLAVNLKDDATFENFFLGRNQQVVHELQQAAQGQGEQFIYFWGISGEGRTHLLQACCHAATQHGRRSVYLPLTQLIDLSPQIFEDLDTLALICVDDLDVLAKHREWEEAFFHAFNLWRESGTRLLVSATVPPKKLGLELSDLVSRLTAGMVFHLEALNDAEKLDALLLRARRRGLNLSEEVGRFLLNHYPRHMSALFAALTELEQASLSLQRRVTVPLVKSVLDKLEIK